jgi:hypothetical protein
MQVAHPAESMWRTFAENCWYIHARELTRVMILDSVTGGKSFDGTLRRNQKKKRVMRSSAMPGLVRPASQPFVCSTLAYF